MGMFDYIMVECPSGCGGIEFQSKEGRCALDYVPLMEASDAIKADLLGQAERCPKCSQLVGIAGSVTVMPMFLPDPASVVK
jgi:hypothetical protein